MELTVTATIAILSCVISVVNYISNRKDKSNKDVVESQKQFSKHDLIEYRLEKIEQNIEKILNKLDSYDKEIAKKIKEAMETHISTYHK